MFDVRVSCQRLHRVHMHGNTVLSDTVPSGTIPIRTDGMEWNEMKFAGRSYTPRITFPKKIPQYGRILFDRQFYVYECSPTSLQHLLVDTAPQIQIEALLVSYLPYTVSTSRM